MFLKWCKNLSIGGEYHLTLNLFNTGVDGEASTAVHDECQAESEDTGMDGNTKLLGGSQGGDLPGRSLRKFLGDCG